MSSESVLEVGTGGTLSPAEQPSEYRIEPTGESEEVVAGEGQAPDPVVEPNEEEEEDPEREKWGSKVSYFLTLVGYGVGFGNLWRFPYQLRENGGLVFLIPYCIMLAVLGIPIFFLELAVGQRRRKGVVYAWAEISPPLGGIGIACGLSFMVGLYYNSLLAYCISYFVDSFRNPLPWTNCTTVSNDDALQLECQDKLHDRSTKYYWYKRTLDISEGYEYPGNYNWWLALYLTITWVLIYFILIKGTKSVGIVVYFTALFPYVVLLAFFIGNLAIEPAKAWLGAYRLLKPNWLALVRPMTWLKAASQIFYSLSLAEGCLVVFSSYCPVRNNCHKDAIYISLINGATSILAALVVFPMIGALGHREYEECYNTMTKYFPNSSLSKESTLYKKYDIYFFGHEGKTWEWMENDTSNAITIRYGYGELNSAEEKKPSEWPTHFDQDYFEEVTWSSVSEKMVEDKKSENGEMISDHIWDCSIGMEATASGGGTGFVFMGFTEAVKHLPGSNFWSAMFFLMLLTLGIDTAFGTVEGVIASAQDLTHKKRWILVLAVVAVMLGTALLLFPFGWGQYVLELLDQWAANWTYLVLALLEVIAVAWHYGLAKFSYDVLLMTGSKPSVYLLICWKFIAPCIISSLLVGSIIQYIIETCYHGGFTYVAFRPQDPDSVEGQRELNIPPYVLCVGILIMLFCVMWVPLQCFLRKTRWNLLKIKAPAHFPEEELRQERMLQEVEHEEDHFTSTEKAIIGQKGLTGLQEQRDSFLHNQLEKKTNSASSSKSTISAKNPGGN